MPYCLGFPDGDQIWWAWDFPWPFLDSTSPLPFSPLPTTSIFPPSSSSLAKVRVVPWPHPEGAFLLSAARFSLLRAWAAGLSHVERHLWVALALVGSRTEEEQNSGLWRWGRKGRSMLGKYFWLSLDDSNDVGNATVASDLQEHIFFFLETV